MMGQEVYEVQRVGENQELGILESSMHRLYVGHGEWVRSEWAVPQVGYRCLRHRINGVNGVETSVLWDRGQWVRDKNGNLPG